MYFILPKVPCSNRFLCIIYTYEYSGQNTELPANIKCFGYDNMCNTDWLSNTYPVAWVFDYVMIISTMFVSYPMLLSDQYKSNHCLCVVISTAL